MFTLRRHVKHLDRCSCLCVGLMVRQTSTLEAVIDRLRMPECQKTLDMFLFLQPTDKNTQDLKDPAKGAQNSLRLSCSLLQDFRKPRTGKVPEATSRTAGVRYTAKS